MIILDTNVISEIIKKQPDEHVANWLRNQDTSNLATTAITVAELLAGICRMPEGKRRKYTDTTVKLALMTLEDRTFSFDTQAAADYAHILVEREHRGTPTSIQDAMIAAIACSWDAAIATRNIKDFEGTDVELINPWEFAQREAPANCRGLVNVTVSPATPIVRRVRAIRLRDHRFQY